MDHLWFVSRRINGTIDHFHGTILVPPVKADDDIHSLCSHGMKQAIQPLKFNISEHLQSIRTVLINLKSFIQDFATCLIILSKSQYTEPDNIFQINYCLGPC